MTADAYRPCPCGSGKKIKFCCSKDIVADLGRVLKALEGDQRAAAVEQLDRLLERHGDRPALLSLKATAQMEVGDWENAQRTIAALTAAAPDSLIALAHAAILACQQGDAKTAVLQLQRALERIELQMPFPVYQAIGVVARLLAKGQMLAARRHLSLQAALGGKDDEEAVDTLMRFNASAEVPLLLKEDIECGERPDDAPWAAAFDEAVELSRRATWLAACDRLEGLREAAPDAAPILRALGVFRSWIGDDTAAVEALRRYSELEQTPLDDAVEAAALAQLIDPEGHKSRVESLCITYQVSDVEKLMERLLSDRRVSQATVDPAEMVEEGEPPPKAIFLLLDRPLPETAAGLTLETIPQIIGHASVFGRQTDRDARLEFLVTRTPDLETKTSALASVVADAAGTVESEEVLGDMPASEAALSWTWRMPDDASMEQREELSAAQRRKVALEVWPETPLGELDGKSPQEVAGDPAWRIQLLAAVLIFEIQGEQQQWDVDFNELRRQMDLPICGPIDPSQVDLATLPLVRLSRLSVSSLSPSDLRIAYRRAVLFNAVAAVRKLALEAVQRDDLTEELSKPAAYDMLVRMARNSGEALTFNDRAREAGVAEGQSAARWLIRELTLRMARGEAEQAKSLVQRIQVEHGDEPEARQALYELMVQSGAVSLDSMRAMAQQAGQPGVPASQEAAAPGKLWLPGQPQPQPQPQPPRADDAGEDKPALWTPGQS